MDAPMIMPEITFDGTNVVVLNMMGNHWTALTGTNRPCARWRLGGDSHSCEAVRINTLSE